MDLDELLETCPDLVAEVPDPLLPPDRTVAGVTEVEQALRTARRVSLCYPDRDQIGPVSLSSQEAKAIVAAARKSPDIVLLTGRCEGADLVLWTVEIPVLPARLRRS